MASGWKRLRMGLTTVLGLERHGFFIPYRYAGGIKDDAAPYSALEDIFAERADAFAEMLGQIDGLRDDLLAIDGTGADRCRWDQDWFPRLDAAAAYTMVRTHRPRRIIEVGSGHSTRFMLRAMADGRLDIQVTAIDPAPRATLENLPVSLERKTLQEADEALFDTIEAGDLVCIDSSHILMPGTDVDIAVNRILPRLKAGTLVFFHDILLPDTYPSQWQWRGYNEQNAVAALLQGGWEVLFSSHYAVTRMEQQTMGGVIADIPLVAGAIETGLWLRKL